MQILHSLTATTLCQINQMSGSQISLPFVHLTSGSRVPIENGVSTVLSRVIKKPASIDPLPPVRVPPKNDNFPAEANHSIHFSFLIWTSIGLHNFNLMKKSFISPSGRTHSLRHREWVPTVKHCYGMGNVRLCHCMHGGAKLVALIKKIGSSLLLI